MCFVYFILISMHLLIDNNRFNFIPCVERDLLYDGALLLYRTLISSQWILLLLEMALIPNIDECVVSIRHWGLQHLSITLFIERPNLQPLVTSRFEIDNSIIIGCQTTLFFVCQHLSSQFSAVHDKTKYYKYVINIQHKRISHYFNFIK